MIQIFRSVCLNNGEKISTEIGRSWSTDEVFAETHAKDYNRYAKKDGFVILTTWIDEEDIDIDNTNFSTDRRPSESEIILNCNISLQAEVHFSTLETYESGFQIIGNAGNRKFEDYL